MAEIGGGVVTLGVTMSVTPTVVQKQPPMEVVAGLNYKYTMRTPSLGLRKSGGRSLRVSSRLVGTKSRSNRRRGKNAEREVAKKLEGRRTRILGVAAPDVEGEWFVAEVKKYMKAPEIPYKYLRELKALDSSERLKLFIYKRPEWRDWVVCILLSDFEDWYGKIPVKSEVK
jgi:hypothetical protein